MKIDIDINCDVGEGIGNEEQLFPYISSCNIACGGHAGDQTTMRKVVKLAIKNALKIGAHPSYPDRENFGRISMNLPVSRLYEQLQSQIESLESVVIENKASLHHIKAHGALYNDIAKNKEKAIIFLNAIEAYKATVFVYVPYKSIVEELAIQRGFKIKREAFADRNYTNTLQLVSRSKSNALIEDSEKVLQHALSIIKDEEVVLPSGERLNILADTLCVHGDTPSALQILMYLSDHLPTHNIHLNK